ncbi:hypothetical protein LINGRAHAP2_LOCUS22247 [Linum grandiflorum]
MLEKKSDKGRKSTPALSQFANKPLNLNRSRRDHDRLRPAAHRSRSRSRRRLSHRQTEGCCLQEKGSENKRLHLRLQKRKKQELHLMALLLLTIMLRLHLHLHLHLHSLHHFRPWIRRIRFSHFRVAERAQAWPIIEFLSTFKYNRKKRSWEKSISFRLGGKPQQCSEDEFGRRLGFYTTEQETSGVLAEYRRFPEYSDVAREVFWQSITTGAAPYDPRSSKITLVHKPMLQFLHQFFRTSITHRGKDGSPNVVGVRDLFLFYCLENGMKVHLGSLVAQLFQNLKRNRGAVALYGGGYVTRLVVSYGCMDAYLGAPPSCPYETVLASDFSDLLADRGATNSSSHDGEEEEDAVPTTLEEIQQWKEQTDATLQQYGQTLRGMCDQIEGMSDHIKGMGDQLDRIEEMQREILRAQQH